MDSVPASRATAVRPAWSQSRPTQPPRSQPPRARRWSGGGFAAAVHGVALTGLILAEAGMLVALCLAVAFAGLGFGLLLIPGLVLAGRSLAGQTRRLAGAWCGVPIDRPYLPPPWDEGSRPSLWRRYGWLLTDQATWRDLLWMTVDCCVGWVLTLAPATLIGWGVFGVIMPAVWSPIVQHGGNNWYAFIHVTSTLTAWLSVPLGIVFILAGLWTGPRLLPVYGRFARWLLAPAAGAQLAQRVRQLSETRSAAVQTGAAEIRRIERDLHDGAQARLVAMGMTLDAADQLLDENPAAARALLAEARDSSVKALSELRDLVRGIHPPVLADRGLADAIRALALDNPLQVTVTAELPGRPERLATFDGDLSITSPPGGPTVATVEIPCALSSPKTSTS